MSKEDISEKKLKHTGKQIGTDLFHLRAFLKSNGHQYDTCDNFIQNIFYCIAFVQGNIYSGQLEKSPPLKFFPVLWIFLRSFKLHKGILTSVLLLFSSFPPFLFSSSPSNSSPLFNLDKNISLHLYNPPLPFTSVFSRSPSCF